MRIYVLALNDVFDTGLATVVDTFSIANDLAVSAGTSSVHFEITVVGVRSRVHTSQGLSVPVVSAAQLPCPDIVLIRALGAKLPATLQAAQWPAPTAAAPARCHRLPKPAFVRRAP